MKNCPKCNSQVDDNAMFCNNCGCAFNLQPQQNAQAQQNTQMPNQAPVATVFNPFDHTAEFVAEDVADNKLFAMLVYLLDFVGIIIALLAKQTNNSPYLSFHIKQSLKITITEILVALIAAVLCWTCIVPFAAGVVSIILVVVKIICFVNICSNKSVEPAIIRSLGFLK